MSSISENKMKLIGELVRYNSRQFIESVIALLDTEEDVSCLLAYIQEHPALTKTDIYEFIIKNRK